MTQQITVRVDGKNFARGVKYAKQFGGQYDGSSKTWSLPATERVINSLRAASAYGLIVVRDSAMNTHEPNCSAYYGGAACECGAN